MFSTLVSSTPVGNCSSTPMTASSLERLVRVLLSCAKGVSRAPARGTSRGVWGVVPPDDQVSRAPAGGTSRGVWGVVPPHDQVSRAPARGTSRGVWGVVPPHDSVPLEAPAAQHVEVRDEHGD